MNHAYWKQFYENKERQKPSPFFEYARQFIHPHHRVIDFGAGDGRDSFPLSNICRKVYVVEPNNRLPFTQFRFLNDVDIGFDVMYARFVLHAVTETVEDKMISLCRKNNARLLAEFRIEPTDDKSHYRRLINVERLHRKLDFIDEYSEGRFSPTEKENPLLARIVAHF